MTKKLIIMKNGRRAILNTENDIFLGNIGGRESGERYYMHTTKHGVKVFYYEIWSAWQEDFTDLAVVEENEAKYFLQEAYKDRYDYDIDEILKIWPDFFEEGEKNE
jgi:hypothetical protein